MTGLFISAFALGIAFCAPPGAVTAEALRRGLARGFRPALFLELGSLVGDATWAGIALIGASVLVQNGPVRLLLSVAGACLLLRLAWSALREARAGHTPLAKIESGAGRGDFTAGAMVSLTNPSAIAFWVSVGGAIAATGVDDPTARHFVVFFTGFMAAAVLWCFFISGLISWGRRLLSASFFRWVNLACAAALALLGLRLLLDTLLTL